MIFCEYFVRKKRKFVHPPERQLGRKKEKRLSMPDTSMGDSQHYEFIHGKRDNTCRQDPTLCNPDARGVQLEAFSGLEVSPTRIGTR